jgi:GT2 family glycosyltransferase
MVPGTHTSDMMSPAESTKDGHLITVALCTHNHRDRLLRTLGNLLALRLPESSTELLVVDNASTDGTAELLAAHHWRRWNWPTRVVREDKLGLSNARNRVIREAIGEYILFMDDDETPDPQWLVSYERAIRIHRPDALGGRIEVMFEDGDRPEWLVDELLGFVGKLDHGSEERFLNDRTTPIFGGNFGFNRELFVRIGTFDTVLGRKGSANIGGEDTEIYRRMITMGCKVLWVPDAVIYHRIQTSKLRRSYFLDLHFRQGRIEGMRKRGDRSRLPPKHLLPQLWRAVRAAWEQWRISGRTRALRKEMNVAYFVGYMLGWAFDEEART